MKKALISVLCLSVLVSCGPTGTRSLAPIDVIKQPLMTSDPVFLRKQTTTCAQSEFTEQRFDIMLNLFMDGSQTTDHRNFLSMISGLRIQSSDQKIISTTTYDEDEESIPRRNRIYVYTRAPGKDVTVCPEVDLYERNTVESAALNTNFFISKTYKAVTSIDKSINLPPIKLKITPKVRLTVRVASEGNSLKSYFKTDNAYFNPGDSSITFLPHSENYLAVRANANFWEVPMVGSHEYGHHIFQALTQNEKSGSSDLHGITSCFSHQLVDAPDANLPAIKADKRIIISAFNEGFADLISYYSLDDTERKVTGVRCLEISRDVGSPVFYDGQEKVFSSDALATFFNPQYYDKKAIGCETTDFRGIHNIGALFAHSADKILSLMTTDKNQKLAVTLNWAKSLPTAQILLADVPRERFIRELFVLFINKASTTLGKPIDKQICEAAEASFPSVSQYMPECQ